MITMSRAMGPPWSGHTRQKACALIHLCAALWLVFYIVYTPIHLYLEPHSVGADCSTSAGPATAAGFVADSDHNGDEHHERHPTIQHKFKLTQPTRAVIAEVLPVQVMEWMDTDQGGPQPQVFGFSGLSPPELLRSWQFFFRAALPVRAPSFLS
jgi:hypothetical protein